MLSGEELAGKIISDDVIRIRGKENPAIRAGYLVTALSHPVLGRPLIKSVAYGSSIPHIDPRDVEDAGLWCMVVVFTREARWG